MISVVDVSVAVKWFADSETRCPSGDVSCRQPIWTDIRDVPDYVVFLNLADSHPTWCVSNGSGTVSARSIESYRPPGTGR